MNRINERVGVQLETEVVPPENEELLVRDFLSQLPILQGRFEGTLAFFASKSKLIVHYEGDRISDDILKQNFVFVVSGLFSRNVDTGDGWYNTLDIIDKNAFLNPTNLLEKPRYKVSATVLTNQAECLMIPRDVFMEVLGKNPEIALSIMNYALKQMELWQTIWLQS